MTTKVNISDLKKEDLGEASTPSVGQNVPFIGHIRPQILPFICIKLPFVPKRRKQSGFTLIELMISLVVLGVITAWALPSIRSFILNTSMVSTSNEFAADFMLARSEAIKRNTPVTVCKSVNGSSCNAVGTNWSTGWLVFIDQTGDGAFTAGADKLLRVGAPSASTVNVTGGAAVANAIVFTKDGLASFVPGGVDSSLTLTDSRGCGSWARKLTVSTTGHPTITSGC